MKKSNFIIFLIGILFIASLVYFSKDGITIKSAKKPAEGNTSETHQTHPSDTKIENTSKALTIQQQEAGEAEMPAVEISPDKQQLIGVKIAVVEVRPLQKIIRSVGRIEYDETKLSTVNTKVEGWIEKLYIDYTGRYVRRGEPLLEIYSPELFATQQEFINALKWLKNDNNPTSPPLSKGGKGELLDEKVSKMLLKDAESLVEASRQRLRLWDISDLQIKKIEETGKPIKTLTIYSPVNGYVVQKMALQGMRVMPGEKLFDIADLSSVWIISDIYEYELPLIKIGQTAKISLNNLPWKEFQSKIEYIYPAISGETRTAKVRFTISNAGGNLKPQMFSNLEIKVHLGKKLSIPEDAVIDTGIRQIVYVYKGDGYFEPREVKLGVSAEGYKEVLMGLKEGDKVASSATFLIDSEAQLKGIKPMEGHRH